MLKVPPEIAAVIQRHVDAIRVEKPFTWPNRTCKELNACIVYGDNVRIWVLRPDGAVFVLDGDSINDDPQPVADPEEIRRVLTRGAEYFPELKDLLRANFGPDAAEAVRAVGEWIRRIDQGDFLNVWRHGDRLEAGRLAGQYIVILKGRMSSHPAPDARDWLLRSHLTDFHEGEPIGLEWICNPGAGDAFESDRHFLMFSGMGPDDSWIVEVARRPDGAYVESRMRYSDVGSSGYSDPTFETKTRTEAEARKLVLEEIGRNGFPEIKVKE